MQVIKVRGGYLVEDEHGFFIGRDGYVARFHQNATPFKSYSGAQGCIERTCEREGRH
jgi:hypothetical protein